MKTTKTFAALLTLVAAFCLTACSGCKTTLAPNGAYNGDLVLYRVDKTVEYSYEVFDKFLKWEHDNAAVLAERPKIKEVADYIRTHAKKNPDDPNSQPGWYDLIAAARAAYLAFPTKANVEAMEAALSPLQGAINDITTIQSGKS